MSVVAPLVVITIVKVLPIFSHPDEGDPMMERIPGYLQSPAKESPSVKDWMEPMFPATSASEQLRGRLPLALHMQKKVLIFNSSLLH